ncbi:MAG: hypothetical protein IT167_11265, partial [Bryobacterales bacterium]|nr:hypothetical protein [Bryobacterales bacterium]
VLACVSAVLLWTPLEARQPMLVCGTERGNAKEEIFLHSRSMAMRARMGIRAAAGPSGKDIGDIAVMYDSGGVIARRNPFNLASKGITFTPSNEFTQYRFETVDSSYDEAAANGGLLSGMGDDDTRRVPIPFAFPFYGKRYSEMWVNSDGNVTFAEGDANPAAKTIGLLAGGPPRIAPLFDDLDPTHSLKGVSVLTEPARVVVTWLEIPEFGARSTLTFQLRLFPDGHFEYAYPNAGAAREAVIGISPGRTTGVELVSFSQGNTGPFPSTVAERFTVADALDSVLLAQRFFQTHEDSYDYLAVYNTVGIAARSFAVATELTVRSVNRAGFGDTVVDVGSLYGSTRRMQAFLNMGPLSNYPRDMNAPVTLRGTTGDTPLTILAHETGHLFLALASIRDPADDSLRPMLGAGLAHWSFNFNSEASFLEGNRIQDNGENTAPRYTTVATVEQYSPLDQYLMGFRPPEQVSGVFLVKGTGFANENPPRKGVSFNGERQNITVDDIIAAEGRRSPDSTVAQRRFRMAVILVVPDGTEPSQADLAQVDQLRASFEGFYQKSASDLASMETGLKKNLQLSLWPAAGMAAGGALNARVSLDEPATANLTVMLRTGTGSASMPESVTIPAGSTEAAFTIRGVRPGVEEITAEPSDSRYLTDHARLQVAGALTDVKLAIVGGDKQVVTASGVALPDQIAVRATDINLIPYPGLTIRAAVETGSVTPASAVTDADGVARFRWIPGTADVLAMRATLDGTANAVTVTALSRPGFQSAYVLNAASYAPGITPGGLAVIFGGSLGGGLSAEAKATPWPEKLAGVQVLINGEAAGLYYVSDGQINFRVPPTIAGDSADVVVSTSLGMSQAVRVPVVANSPGLFFNQATGEAAVRVAGTGLLTSERPAAAGEYLEIYGTGLGPVEPSPKTDLYETVRKPVITAGGVEARVVFSGQAPGVPGLYQVNAQVPDGAPRGVVKLRIMVDGAASNEANVTLR